jgi:hypothetical protein
MSLQVGDRKRKKYDNTAYARRWREKNREKSRASSRLWRSKNAEAAKRSDRATKLKRTYGLTLEQFEEMLSAQGRACAICLVPLGRQPKDTHVDHCHTTGVIRGILCNDCNNVLARARDNPDVLRRAASYLGHGRPTGA